MSRTTYSEELPSLSWSLISEGFFHMTPVEVFSIILYLLATSLMIFRCERKYIISFCLLNLLSLSVLANLIRMIISYTGKADALYYHLVFITSGYIILFMLATSLGIIRISVRLILLDWGQTDVRVVKTSPQESQSL